MTSLRRPAAALVLPLALTTLTARGDGGGDDVTLTYQLWDEQQKAGYEKVMAAFEAANPGIDVEIEVLPWDQYWTKLTADAVAGTAPDVFWMQPSSFPECNVETYGFASWNHYQTQWMNWVGSGHYTFNDPASVAALQFGVGLVNEHHVSPPATQTNPPTGDVTDMVKRGEVAMFPANNALLPFVAPEANVEVGVALMPEGPAGRSVNINGLAEAVYSGSEHKEEAMTLAAYLGTEGPQKLMADEGYVFPAINGLGQGYVDHWKNNGGLDVSPFLTASQGQTFPLPVTTGFETELNQIFNEMYLGDITPQEAADQAVQAGNAAVDGS